MSALCVRACAHLLGDAAARSTDRTVVGGDLDNALGPVSAVAVIAYPVAALLFPERLG